MLLMISARLAPDQRETRADTTMDPGKILKGKVTLRRGEINFHFNGCYSSSSMHCVLEIE